jgi:hypothetical protein
MDDHVICKLTSFYFFVLSWILQWLDSCLTVDLDFFTDCREILVVIFNFFFLNLALATSLSLRLILIIILGQLTE